MARAKVFSDLEFAWAGSESLCLDLYVPELETPPPLVVWIHGGGWREGSKARPPLRRLTECGFALASISHRFTSNEIFPAQLHDAKAAVRWLRGNSRKYGYDDRWIAACGASSGGHLSLLLGLTPEACDLDSTHPLGGSPHLDFRECSSTVQAVVDYYAPTDFVHRGRTQPDIAYSQQSGSFALLGGVRLGAVDQKLEIIASPIHHVHSSAPPLLAFHGTDDTLVLADQSERIVAEYRRHGASAKLIMLPGAGHGGPEFYWGTHFDAAQHFLSQAWTSFQ